MQWLRKSHPEAAAEYPAFFTGNNDGSDLGYPSSLTHLLSYLPVASPVAILTSGSSMETGDDVTNDEATSKTVEYDDGLSETNSADSNMFTKNTDLSKSTVAKSVSNHEYSSKKLTEKSNNAAGATSTVEITANNLPGDESNPEKLSEKNVNTPVTGPAVSDDKTKEVEAKNTPSQDNDKLRYISKYLVQFVPDAKPQNKEATVRISGARVLTTEKCAAILKECEEKSEKRRKKKRVGSC